MSSRFVHIILHCTASFLCVFSEFMVCGHIWAGSAVRPWKNIRWRSNEAHKASMITFPIWLFFKKYKSYLLARGFICRQIASAQTPSRKGLSLRSSRFFLARDKVMSSDSVWTGRWMAQWWFVATSAALGTSTPSLVSLMEKEKAMSDPWLCSLEWGRILLVPWKGPSLR